jgi:hypothetical protein
MRAGRFSITECTRVTRKGTPCSAMRRSARRPCRATTTMTCTRLRRAVAALQRNGRADARAPYRNRALRTIGIHYRVLSDEADTPCNGDVTRPQSASSTASTGGSRRATAPLSRREPRSRASVVQRRGRRGFAPLPVRAARRPSPSATARNGVGNRAVRVITRSAGNLERNGTSYAAQVAGRAGARTAARRPAYTVAPHAFAGTDMQSNAHVSQQQPRAWLLCREPTEQARHPA